jgi:hypothetical protein
LFTAMTGIFTPAYSVSKRTGSDGLSCYVGSHSPPRFAAADNATGDSGGQLTTTTADFFVQFHPGQPSATNDTALHALVARLNVALDGLGSVASTHMDPTGSYELVASVVPASAWVRAWGILRTQLSHFGVLDDAHVSLFIVTNDAAAAEEDRVLWVGRNLRDA